MRTEPQSRTPPRFQMTNLGSTLMGQIQKTLQSISELRWFGTALKKQGWLTDSPGLDASAGGQPPRWPPVTWQPCIHTLLPILFCRAAVRPRVFWKDKGCAFGVGCIYSSSLYPTKATSWIILQRGAAWQGTEVLSASMWVTLEEGCQDVGNAMLTFTLQQHRRA